MITQLLLLLLVASSTCLVRVNSPQRFQKDYQQAKLDLFPRKFNVTASLIVADPFSGCAEFKNADQVKGKIVIIEESGACLPEEKTRRIVAYGAVGAILAGSQGTLGLYYNYKYDPDESVQMPAISTSVQEFQDVIDYLNDNPSHNVTATIMDTDENPWLEYGQGPAGILFQIYFQVINFITFCAAVYKLRYYIKYKGLLFHVPHISLSLEIGCSILRFVYMLRPLSFYYWHFDIIGDAFTLGYSNNLSFMTDLLITFYWQEILVKCDRKLSNKILNNLDKFKIPFGIACLIIWVLDTIADLARGVVIRFGNAVVLSAIVYVIFTILIAGFFFYTGIRVLKITGSWKCSTTINSRRTRRVSKLMKIIMITGSMLILQIIAIFLQLSPAATASVPSNVTIFWLWWTGLFGASLSKVLMFETPTKASSDVSSDGQTKGPSDVPTASKSNDLELTKTETSESLEAELSV